MALLNEHAISWNCFWGEVSGSLMFVILSGTVIMEYIIIEKGSSHG